MKDNPSLPFIVAAIESLKEGESSDLSDYFLSVRVPAPSLIHDFIVEIALTAWPDNEHCFSVAYLEKALQEVLETGTTNMLEKGR